MVLYRRCVRLCCGVTVCCLAASSDAAAAITAAVLHRASSAGSCRTQTYSHRSIHKEKDESHLKRHPRQY